MFRHTMLAVFAALLVAGPFPLAYAAPIYTISGDVSPSDPSTWTSSTECYIGNTGSGSLRLTSGTLSSLYGYLGYNPGCSGTVTIDGVGSTWNASAEIYTGYSGNGTLIITNGGAVHSDYSSVIGLALGSRGVATVDGIGSTWTIGGSGGSYDLYVSEGGTGTLNISHGGAVAVNGTTYVGYGGSGIIKFGVGGGTLTTASLVASTTHLTGTGTINTRGLLADDNLTFDSPGSLKRTLTVPGQNVAINLDMSADPSQNGVLGAGWRGTGSVTIKNGVTVVSKGGDIGYLSGSNGVVTVDGVGSVWNPDGAAVGVAGQGTLNVIGRASVITNSGAIIGENFGSCGTVNVRGAGSVWTVGNSNLIVGKYGDATLNITGGGVVNATGAVSGVTDTCIARYSGAGVVRVDGVGSKLTSNTTLYVGGNQYGGGGNAKLSITGGGTVSANSAVGNWNSLVAVDVGRSSLLALGGGAGAVTNNGTVRILAGAGVPVDDSIKYSPISAATWGGTGTYQAIGGKWDSSNHQFTASTVVSGTSGSAVSLNLATVERTLVTYHGSDGTNWAVGASFPATANTSNITFTAIGISGATLAALKDIAGTDDDVLSGWTFAASGYSVNYLNSAYYSFRVGAGLSLEELELWQYSGSTWASYTPFDLTYDGMYASFTAADLSGYAVTPEPSTFALLGIGVLGLLAYAWRRR